MDFRQYDSEPIYGNDEGSNLALYYCSICNDDTLHKVIDVDEDQYFVRCTKCGTASLTRADYFDPYEEESIGWTQELRKFFPDSEEYI